MYIIIIGGGRVGYYLTKTLLNEGHEVLIIEKNATYCETINNELGTVCIQGDGCETATLAEVGTERADMFVAVTGEDQDNLVACQIAKHKFNVQRTIARIRNPQNEVLFKKLGMPVRNVNHIKKGYPFFSFQVLHGNFIEGCPVRLFRFF